MQCPFYHQYFEPELDNMYLARVSGFMEVTYAPVAVPYLAHLPDAVQVRREVEVGRHDPRVLRPQRHPEAVHLQRIPYT